MALGADASFPELLSHMEPESCRTWTTRIPVPACASRPGTSTGLAQDRPAKAPERDRIGQKKTVTMAPRSRYLTGKSPYVVRKPLFASCSHTSILKKPPLEEPSEQEVEPGQGCSDLDGHLEFMSSLLAGETTDPSTASPANASSLSTSADALSMPLSTLDLRSWSPHEDPGLAAGSQANMLSRRRLPGPPLDVHSLTVQTSPKWNSTQKSSSLGLYSSSSSHLLRRNRLEHILVKSGDTSLIPGSSLADKSHPLSLHRMSPFQADYWACTIPSCLLRSPDRKSPNWDPDKEYETLLDYTYPLRPNHAPTLDSPDRERASPMLLDSGIELDRLCSSSNLSGSAHSDQPMGERRRGLNTSEQLISAPKDSKRYGCRLFGSWHSSVDQKGLSVESLLETQGKEAQCWTHGQKQGIFASRDPAAHFIPTWRVLPARRMAWGSEEEEEEEYHALPAQLQELQVLSLRLQALSLHICKSRHDSSESLETETCSEQTSRTLVEKCGEAGPWEGGLEPLSGSPCSQGSVEGEALEASLQGGLRELASCMGHLSGLAPGGVSLSDLQGRMEPDQEGSEAKQSLMQQIQDFCCSLEQLIIWLYTVVERMERLTPPTVEIESVKSSLADYQSFQRELSSQQPLTSTVLHRGGLLLRCLDTTSPVLKETLRQIEKQSRALEAHADHLFSSILSAMDSLTDPSSSDTEVPPLSTQLQDLKESCWLTEQD
ncbi:hypothetical protein COCON_G00220640 [Conger conger]|uniref:Centrosomal protein of 68 kDa n=1 Tax=Conger conger TaxID=82655 RepID=A0A9Q1HMI7_CONCO|nr:hypothetical protein COCON_G00220640 [Conger conger]